MKKTITVLAILVMITGLCAGCKNDKAADTPESETEQQTQESSSNDWEPETAGHPEDHNCTNNGHGHGDHTGHNH